MGNFMEGAEFFEDEFFTNPDTIENILKESGIRGNPTVLISIVSVTNENDAQRVRQIVKLNNSKQVHMAEYHRVRNSSVLYTKDISNDGKNELQMETTKVSSKKLEHFENVFSTEMSKTNSTIPKLSIKSHESDDSVSELPPKQISKKTATPSPVRRAQDIDIPKKSSRPTPQKVSTPKRTTRAVSPRRRDAEQDPLPKKKTTAPEDGGFDLSQWKRTGKLRYPPESIVREAITTMNRIRKGNKLGVLKCDKRLSKYANIFAGKSIRPDDFKDHDFDDVTIPEAFQLRMSSITMTCVGLNPITSFLDSVKDEEEKYETSTHIGLGIVNIDNQYGFCRIYGCFRPDSVDDVIEITRKEEKYLMQLINDFRVANRKKKLTHSRTITDRAMRYIKLLFTGMDPDSDEALDEIAEIIHDNSFRDYSGATHANTDDPILEIFQQVKKNNRNQFLENDDLVGTTIVHDGRGHWMWLLSFEHYS